MWSPLSADSALMSLHTRTNFDNHTLISTPGAFKFSNHCSSLNLIGHVHIPTWVTKAVPDQSGQTLPPRAGDAIHPAQCMEGLVWFMRLKASKL